MRSHWILLWLGCVVGEGIKASRHQGIEEEASSFALICPKATALMLLAYHRDHQGAVVGTNVAFQVDDLLPRAQHK